MAKLDDKKNYRLSSNFYKCVWLLGFMVVGSAKLKT